MSRKSLEITKEPIFGKDLYDKIASSKIVVNLAIDFAKNYRGNMRCFETLGCGALLLTDTGIYPRHMVDGETIITFDDSQDAISKINDLLSNEEKRIRIATSGHNMVIKEYSK